MELYFIRHGQSQNNANWNDSNYRENPDPPLTDLVIAYLNRTDHLPGHLITG